MAVAATDLRWLNGFLVADREGRVVGRVECPMYGTAPDVPDALAVRSGFLARRALGPHIFDRYVELKRKEWDEYRVQLSEWELSRYLSVL